MIETKLCKHGACYSKPHLTLNSSQTPQIVRVNFSKTFPAILHIEFVNIYRYTQTPLIRAPWDRALPVSPSCPYRTMILTIVFSHFYSSNFPIQEVCAEFRRLRRAILFKVTKVTALTTDTLWMKTYRPLRLNVFH